MQQSGLERMSSLNLKIGIGISFYQDFDSLYRMLQSLQSYPIDTIIAVDGKYAGHPAGPLLSDNDVLNLLNSFQTRTFIFELGGRSQIEQRQIYFEKSKEYGLDVIIVMDSDEYIIHERTDWRKFVEELEEHIRMNKDTYVQGYSIPLIINQKRYKEKDHTINSPRVFYRPWELQYVDNHWTIRNKKTGVAMGYQTDRTKLESLVIGH